MTNELKKAIETVKEYLDMDSGVDSEYLNAQRMIIQAVESQPTDAVSREAVIDHICEDKECYKEECKGKTLKRCPDLQWVFDLPPVIPEKPKGKWIHPYKSDIACECSECHIQMPITNYYHYCPNCGAEMSGGDE